MPTPAPSPRTHTHICSYLRQQVLGKYFKLKLTINKLFGLPFPCPFPLPFPASVTVSVSLSLSVGSSDVLVQIYTHRPHICAAQRRRLRQRHRAANLWQIKLLNAEESLSLFYSHSLPLTHSRQTQLSAFS